MTMRRQRGSRFLAPVCWLALALWLARPFASAQDVAICGTVLDQSGAAVMGAAVQLNTSLLRLNTTTDNVGGFCFRNLQPGPFELSVTAPGFLAQHQAVVAGVTNTHGITISLRVDAKTEQVTVVEGTAAVGSLNVAQTQIGTGLLENLPSESVNAALSSILTLATPGVAADSNGV